MQATSGELDLAELGGLDEILAMPVLEHCSMDVATLEGFLTALAIGPNTVLPEQWLPWVWDMHDARIDPEFASLEQANWVMDLIFRYQDLIRESFRFDPSLLRPAYERDEEWGAAEWAEGFLLATMFDRADWVRLMDAHPDWFLCLRQLVGDPGLQVTQQQIEPEQLPRQVRDSVRMIHEYWKHFRAERAAGSEPAAESGEA